MIPKAPNAPAKVVCLLCPKTIPPQNLMAIHLKNLPAVAEPSDQSAGAYRREIMIALFNRPIPSSPQSLPLEGVPHEKAELQPPPRPAQRSQIEGMPHQTPTPLPPETVSCLAQIRKTA